MPNPKSAFRAQASIRRVLRPLTHALPAALVLSAAACGPAQNPSDAGPNDAGHVSDAGAGDAGPQDAGPAYTEPRFETLAAAIEADLADSNATAASVAIWEDGDITWVGGFGTISEADARRPDVDTQFMIGSDTKKMTSVLALQQVEAGKLTLDGTVADTLTALRMPRGGPFLAASLHELLSQQGGLNDHTGALSHTATDDELHSYTHGQFAREAYSMVPAGRLYNYSNPNFSIAGLMTEQVAGRAWPDIATEDLFAPLGMTRTVARKADVDENHATGVGMASSNDAAPRPVGLDETWENAFTRPAGLVWSTPSDHLRFVAFLMDGDAAVLRDDLRTAVSAAHVATNPDLPGAYGYGLTVFDSLTVGTSRYENVRLWMHGGNTTTHTSTFAALPDQRFAVAILSNGVGDNFQRSLAAALVAFGDLPAPGPVPEPVFDPASIDTLVGDYLDENNVGALHLTRDGDTMRLAAPALDQAGVPYGAVLTPITNRVWRASIQNQPLALRFVDGPDGELYIVHRAFVATRTDAPDPDMPAPSMPGTPGPAPHVETPRAAWLPSPTRVRAALDPLNLVEPEPAAVQTGVLPAPR